MSKKNGGIEEEIKVSNHFSSLGYFTRFNVQIYPEEGQKNKVSDIDVFAVKFDELLLPTKNIIETKRNSDKISVLFQLYGFKEFYEDSNAFFVNRKTSNMNLNISNKLNIRSYSFNNLEKLVKKSKSFKNVVLNTENGLKLKKYIERIKIINKDLYWNYNYLWIEKNPFRKLNDIQEMFQITDKIYNKFNKDEAFLWFRKELFMMSFLSIIEISSKCIALNSYDINSFIKEQYYNLGTSKQRKKDIKAAVDKLIKIIEDESGEEINLDLSLVPTWIDLLIKIVKKIITNSKYASKYLIINDNVHKSYIIENPKHLSVYSNETELKIISSINSDLLILLHKNEILSDFNFFI